jgi:hypothetical protein
MSESTNGSQTVLMPLLPPPVADLDGIQSCQICHTHSVKSQTAFLRPINSDRQALATFILFRPV